MESSGIKLGRGVGSRRRLPHERPHFVDTGEGHIRLDKDLQLQELIEGKTPGKAAATGLRRSKSLHAKAAGGKSPEGDRERALLSWNLSKAKRKERLGETKPPKDVDRMLRETTNRHELPFDSPGPADEQHDGTKTDFISRLVSVIGDISCPVHPDRSIQSCPRECGWHIEHHVERGNLDEDKVDQSNGTGSDSTTLVASISPTDSRPSTFHEILLPPKQYTLGVRPCYILICLGIITIVGSLAPALWRANVHDDLSGGFTLAQYILGVGIFIVGSMVAIHSRSCTCWHSSR